MCARARYAAQMKLRVSRVVRAINHVCWVCDGRAAEPNYHVYMRVPKAVRRILSVGLIAAAKYGVVRGHVVRSSDVPASDEHIQVSIPCLVAHRVG